MSDNQEPPLVFSADELDLLGRTADALSAYMGKPVLAEVMDAEETGFEWVIFAVPLDVQDDPSDFVVVQIGGPEARIIGNKGGMTIAADDVFDCEYLWAIQLSDLEGVRYIKVDQEGDEVAWADTLQDILPFVMADELAADSDDDDAADEDEDDDDDDPYEGGDPAAPRTLH
ncbi:hypothetical protein ACSBPU_16980 [Parapusillimonas sp. JC17]|uniref:hypothetical protein n=1 Tax=Parapusillimonas sp. JC17 TaxID=3445768 RepID=UPI003FA0946B